MDQVHLIHCEYEVLDTHKGTDTGVSSGLYQHALGGVHQDDRQLREGSAHGHVSCILFMTRSVRHDERTVVRGEVAVSHVDGDTLLSLRHEAVQKQRIVDGAAAGADLAVQLQRFFLVCK